MSLSAYQMGFKHAKDNKRYLEHREGRPYDSENDNRSYFNGYQNGLSRPAKLDRPKTRILPKKKVTQ